MNSLIYAGVFTIENEEKNFDGRFYSKKTINNVSNGLKVVYYAKSTCLYSQLINCKIYCDNELFCTIDFINNKVKYRVINDKVVDIIGLIFEDYTTNYYGENRYKFIRI